jgi:hypothetical protein
VPTSSQWFTGIWHARLCQNGTLVDEFCNADEFSRDADHGRDADHVAQGRDADRADQGRDADRADHGRDADRADHGRDIGQDAARGQTGVRPGSDQGQTTGWVTVRTLDSLRRRIYIAPLGLYLTLDSGPFESLTINPATRAVRVALAPAGSFTPNARLRIEQPAKVTGVGAYAPAQAFASERGAVVVPLGKTATVVELRQK